MNFDLGGSFDALPGAVVVCPTEDLQVPEGVRHHEIIMQTVLDNINVIIYVSDFDTHEILFANKYLKEILAEKGITDVEGKICWETLQKGQKGPCPFCPCPRLRDKKGLPLASSTWEHKNSITKKWCLATDSAIPWIDGRYVHMEMARDISEIKEKEKDLKQKARALRTVASTDPLTGVYNRQMGGVLLEEGWKRAMRTRKKSTLCFLDLDALKEVNDSLGHSAGDQMLVDFSNIVKRTIRKVDTFCRWGGDEFILLLEGCTVSDSKGFTIQRIQRYIDVFNQESREKEGAYQLSFSYGLQEVEGTLPLEQLIAMADQKMYNQKMDKKMNKKLLLR
jgi:diguanylate cyclase (GGDEF)-like protein